jgi:hypothetical protein
MSLLAVETTFNMKHDQLKIDLQSPTVALINSDNAPLILSFFAQEFLQDPRPTLPLDLFTEHLEIYLERLTQQYPHLYRDTAPNYLKQWSEDKGWLRIYRSGSSPDYVVELTTHAQHALAWVEDLQQREFVGTQSRFSQILKLLQEIVLKSNSSAEDRIRQLEIEKARIEREIEQIQETGQVEQLTPLEVRERFQLATEQAGQLLRDFTAVEDRFREIARLIQQEQIKPDARKGVIVGKVLDADERMRDSEVGRSFYAFWDYLQQPIQRDELYRLLDAVFNLDDLLLPAQQVSILRNMPRYLIEAGLKVDQSNQRLAEQLRRMLDETNAAESRRIRALISEVKQLFGEHPALTEEKQSFLTLETLPEVQLVMERKLWSPKENTHFEVEPLQEAELSAFDADLSGFIEVFYVDATQIRERIEGALDQQTEISLIDLLHRYPVEKGLPEVLAYLQFAARADNQHLIDASQQQEVTVRAASAESDKWLLLQLPHIVFRRVQRG